MDIKGIVSDFEERERAADKASEKKRQEDAASHERGTSFARKHLEMIVAPVLHEARNQLREAGYPVKLIGQDANTPGSEPFPLIHTLWVAGKKTDAKLASFITFTGQYDGTIAVESHVRYREDGVKREGSQALDMFTKESITKRVEDFVREVLAHQARVDHR